MTDNYDEHGNLIEVKYYDEQGHLARNKYGVAKEINLYDENGLLQSCMFDEKNRLLERSKIIDIILPGGQADKLGIRVGDVLKSYNGEVLRNAEHLIKQVDQLGTDDRELILLRKGKPLRFFVAPGKIGMGFEHSVPTNGHCLIDELEQMKSLTKTAIELEAKEDLVGALKNHRKILSILEAQSATTTKDNPMLQSMNAAAYRAMGYILIEQNDWSGAVNALRKSVTTLEELMRHNPNKTEEYKTRLVSTLGALSYSELFVKYYEQSLTSAHRALELEPKELWIKTNIAHALLFLNRFEEARAVYLENSEVVFQGKRIKKLNQI